ncbi:ABC transporter permease [Telmatospirillum sp. J64-1]|uniref:ABC transporter permease n=1 Tax=Telmatospirillum sp. J64-1 TaxID=2502183 RepID=UPI00115D7253|nr:ABC transporter permease [Telmatospirillum sp. J64-1]
MTKRQIQFLFVIPAVFVAFLLVASLFSILQFSVREHVPGSLVVGGFTLDNFGRVLRPVYASVLRTTMELALSTALLTLVLSYPLAYALARVPSKAIQSLILIISITPLFTGDIVRTYAWLIVLGNNGFVNSTLMALGIIERPLQLMYTQLGVTLALVQYSIPVMVMVLTTAIAHIDRNYEKAAASLGAGPVRVFLKVTLPLSTPGIIAGVITIFAWTLSAFATPQLIGGGKVMMLSNMVYLVGFSSFDFPFAAVLSLIGLVVSIALLVAMNWSSRRVEKMGLH